MPVRSRSQLGVPLIGLQLSLSPKANSWHHQDRVYESSGVPDASSHVLEDLEADEVGEAVELLEELRFSAVDVLIFYKPVAIIEIPI